MSLLCKWAVAIYPVLKIDKEIRQDYVFTLGYFFLRRRALSSIFSLIHNFVNNVVDTLTVNLIVYHTSIVRVNNTLLLMLVGT